MSNKSTISFTDFEWDEHIKRLEEVLVAKKDEKLKEEPCKSPSCNRKKIMKDVGKPCWLCGRK